MLGRDGRGTAVVAIALGVAMVAGCTGDKTESPAPGTTVASSAVTSTQSPSSGAPSGTSVSASSAGSSMSVSGSPSVTADPALVAEAKKVNEKQFEVESALFSIGGLPPGGKPPKELTEVMMGEGLTLTMQAMNETFVIGRKRVSGTSRMPKVRPTNEWDLEGSLIAIESCRDDRGVTYKDSSGTSQRGLLILFTAFLKRDAGGQLKVARWSGEKVASCPF